MILTLSEAKQYLRIDTADDDSLLTTLMDGAEQLCADVVRVSVSELEELMDNNIRTAVLYATAYLYEHREDADHHALIITLRSILFGVRKEGF